MGPTGATPQVRARVRARACAAYTVCVWGGHAGVCAEGEPEGALPQACEYAHVCVRASAQLQPTLAQVTRPNSGELSRSLSKQASASSSRTATGERK